MSKIDTILENEALALVTNKDALAELDEGQLDALLALADEQPETGEDEREDDPVPEDDPEPEQEPEQPPAVDLSGIEARLDAIEGRLSANADAEKNALVMVLAKNEKLGLTAEQLGKMGTDTLKALRKSMRPRSYAGQAGGVQDNGSDITPMKKRPVLSRKEEN